MAEQESNDQFSILNLSKSKNKAAVWDHFGFKKNETEYCICIHCQSKLKYSGNTTNLRNHLKGIHRAIFNELDSSKKTTVVYQSQEKTLNSRYNVDGASSSTSTNCQSAVFESRNAKQPTIKQQSIQESLFVHAKYPKEHAKQRNSTDLLTKFITKGMHALRIVEEPEFITFVGSLDPKYKIPNRKELTGNLVPQLYDTVKEKIVNKLRNATNVVVTFDFWTSRATDQYLGLTAHFIEVGVEWTLQSFVLETSEVPPPHTADAIVFAVTAALEKWEILDKVSVIVSDNAANCVKAISDLGRNFIPCFGHTLNLGIKKGVKAGIARCTKLAEHFHRSAAAKYCLENKQKQLGLPEHKLIIRCETRWNSIHAMLKRIIEQQQAICAALLQLDKRDLMPEMEMITIEKLVDILEPFSELTEDFSSESVITISSLLPTLHQLKSNLKPDEHDSTTIACIKDAMLNDLEDRYTDDNVNAILTKACYLDARFKSLPFLTQIDKCEIEHLIETEIVQIINESHFSTSDEEHFQTQLPPAKKMKGSLKMLQGLYGTTNPHDAPSSPETIAKEEIARYRTAPSPNLETDPLVFWALNANLYPNLEKLAKKYLAIPATSTPAERLFSNAGFIINSKRASLNPKNVNMLTFLSANL